MVKDEDVFNVTQVTETTIGSDPVPLRWSWYPGGVGVIKPAWNHPKTSQAKPSQAGLAWLVLQKRGSWLGLAWLVNSRRGHWLGFDLAFRQATHHDYI